MLNRKEMRIHITTKNMELTDEINKHVEEKIGELDKFINYPGEEVKAIKGKVKGWIDPNFN